MLKLDKLMQDKLKCGPSCFRFYGHWLGRDTDSIYKIVKTECINDILTITLENDEKVIVSNPVDIHFENDSVQIKSATKIQFQWYYAGRSKSDENLYYYQFEKKDDKIISSINVDWRNIRFKTDSNMLALEFWFYRPSIASATNGLFGFRNIPLKFLVLVFNSILNVFSLELMLLQNEC